MRHTLIKTGKYSGNYVVIRDLNKPVVIAYGKDPREVYYRAVKKGFKEPILIYVPPKGTVQIYQSMTPKVTGCG